MLRTAMMTAIALALAVPGFAQQQTDPQLKQHAEALYATWEKGVSDHDASALKALMSPAGFVISAYGFESPDTFEKGAERNKAAGLITRGALKDVQQIDADTALSYGPYEVTFTNPPGRAEGNWMQVLEKQGSEWKIRAMTYSRQVSQQQPASGSTSK